MPPRIKLNWSNPSSRSRSPAGESKRECGSNPGDLTPPIQYQWQDLLNQNLQRPMDIDAALTGVLRSTAEMDEIQGLGDQDFQKVVDILYQYLGTGDVMDGVRKKCFKLICKICAAREVLPTQCSLEPGNFQQSDLPDHKGGFGEVWKGKSGKETVAIKKLMVNAEQLKKQKERFCHEVIMWKRLANQNTLPLLGAYICDSKLVMISEWMENGNIMQYLRRNPAVNRPSLLADAARGVVYLHSMNIVHGDLKGVNILVKGNGSACLADFGLVSITLDPETTDITATTDAGHAGTYRWMSPELFIPSDFDLPKFQLTRESDCYAFGMVIYEVLSGKIPFEEIKQSMHIPFAVREGTRPRIPEGPPSMVKVWKLAEQCWSQKPSDRPSFPTVQGRLDTFATIEDVTPFALREPRPMRVKEQPSETTTEWQPPLTAEVPNAVSPVDSLSQSSYDTSIVTLSQPAAYVKVDSSQMGAREKLRRTMHVVLAAIKFSRSRFETATKSQAPLTREVPNSAPLVDPLSQSSFDTASSQPKTRPGVDSSRMEPREKLRRAMHVVRAAIRFSKSRPH